MFYKKNYGDELVLIIDVGNPKDMAFMVYIDFINYKIESSFRNMSAAEIYRDKKLLSDITQIGKYANLGITLSLLSCTLSHDISMS